MPDSLPRGAEHRRLHRFHSLVGLAIALVLLLVVFTAPVVASEPDTPPVIPNDPIVPVFIPPTHHQPPPPPPPPAPPPPKAVSNDTDVEDEIQAVVFNITDDVALPSPPLAPPPPPVPPAPAALPPPEPPVADPPIEDNVWVFVEQDPELIGGLEGLQARVEYPELARRVGIEGRVFITFVVDERGNVVDPQVARSPSDLLSEAALKAVRESKFQPGQQRGRPVKVRYSLPVNFVLR